MKHVWIIEHRVTPTARPTLYAAYTAKKEARQRMFFDARYSAGHFKLVCYKPLRKL